MEEEEKERVQMNKRQKARKEVIMFGGWLHIPSRYLLFLSGDEAIYLSHLVQVWDMRVKEGARDVDPRGNLWVSFPKRTRFPLLLPYRNSQVKRILKKLTDIGVLLLGEAVIPIGEDGPYDEEDDEGNEVPWGKTIEPAFSIQMKKIQKLIKAAS